MLYVIRIGRWSEPSSWVVCQSVRGCSVLVMVVMSGEVGCWSVWGCLVGVLVLRVI